MENVFGIIFSVFRVLRKPMLLEPEKAEVIVMAIVNLFAVSINVFILG